jgi:putative tricarboxylic transport membrane protein
MNGTGSSPAARVDDRAAGDATSAAARGELGLAALLVVVGCAVLGHAATLHVPATTVVGPRFFPTLVGVVLVVAGTMLAVAVLRGRTAEPEEGDDVDPNAPTDWRALGWLAAALTLHTLFLLLLGYVLAVAVLFTGAARAFGSRRPLRDALAGIAFGLVVYLVFTKGLALTLPRGWMERWF